MRTEREHRLHNDSARGRLVALLFAAAVLLALGVSPAAANIYDADATPDNQLVVASPGSDVAGEVIVADGVVWMTGSVVGTSTSVPSLLRLPLGSALWARRTASFAGRGMDLARGPSGSVYMSGHRFKADSLTMIPLVAKWSSAGRLVWQRSYTAPVAGNGTATDVGADADGNVIMCGWAPGEDSNDWVVASWSPSGKRRWVWRYSGSGNGSDMPQELFVDKGGSTYVTGNVTLEGGVSAACTVKLSPTGKALWVKKYPGPEGEGAWTWAIVRRKAGGVYVGGEADRYDGSRDAIVLRYTAAGSRTVLPPYTIGGVSTQLFVNDLAIAADGTIVAVGSYDTGTDTDQLLCTWNADESTRSHWVWATPYIDSLWYVAADPFGGVCTNGTYANGNTTDTSILTRRMRFTFGAYWAYDWAGPQVARHSVSGIAAWRDWVVTGGACQSGGTGTDQFIQIWRY